MQRPSEGMEGVDEVRLLCVAVVAFARLTRRTQRGRRGVGVVSACWGLPGSSTPYVISPARVLLL